MMHPKTALRAAAFAFLMGHALIAHPVRAEGPTPTSLPTYLAKLRKTPQDQALRAKIIESVLAMSSPPPVPDEAAELKGWADAALKDAKTSSDFLAAAKAYEKALDLAPWVAADYLGLADALEKAGDYPGAAGSLRLYLLASPRAKDAEEVRERLGALKYKEQKGQAPAGSASVGDALARFKKLAAGEYRKAYDCGHDAPLQALRKRELMRCEKADYDAGRWYPYDVLGAREFRFPEDGTIEFWTVRSLGNSLELLGKPQGPGLEDIRWFQCDGSRCAKSVWARLSEDLGAITYSVDRPVDDSAFDPKARYAYRQYRK